MTFDEWYRSYWRRDGSKDKEWPYGAWLAAKDFNLTNLKDLEHICEVAAGKFTMLKEPSWAERAQKYREILHDLASQRIG